MPLPTNEELISSFLESFVFICPNLNDTFHYASADTEQIYLDSDGNQDMLVDVWVKFGFPGVIAYVAKMRGTEPIFEMRTDAYYQAKLHLENWQYEKD